ncbi:MAG: nucleotidyltransferase domain-containing protein [Oscillospiraceae bacterium]|nr:nucleotidyltransferase domain-containing protein [Oscillospiraceae bacterium]
MDIVLGIIKKHVPDSDVLAFGSRSKWTNRETSDLDLAIVGKSKTSLHVISNMKYDFMESDLTFRVDVVDYNAVSESFMKIIDNSSKLIYSGMLK